MDVRKIEKCEIIVSEKERQKHIKKGRERGERERWKRGVEERKGESVSEIVTEKERQKHIKKGRETGRKREGRRERERV